jgi:acetyl esterase/lipase
MLVYPMLDDRQTTASSQRDEAIWPPAANRFGWSCYLGEAAGGKDVSELAAPARAEDLSGLPPAFVMVGDLDGFCDEDVAFAERLRRAGVPTELHVFPGSPHGFERLGGEAKVAVRARDAQRSWLIAQLG